MSDPTLAVGVYRYDASGITEPRDLAGKTVGGFALHGHDAGVWRRRELAARPSTRSCATTTSGACRRAG
jgi:hypothetical protein